MAQRISRVKRSVVIVAAIVLGLAGVGVAYAYWTSTGTGDGTATTDTSTPFTVTPGALTGTIVPGGVGETMAFTVDNPAAAAGPQHFTVVTVSIENADGSAWVPPVGCDAADYHAAITTAPPAGDIAVGASVDGEATVTLDNTAVNQDACQGIPVPLHFVAA